MESPGISINEIADNKAVKSYRHIRNIYMFSVQIILIYFVVVASIGQLIWGNTENKDIWLVLLSSSLGYILPSPKLRSKLL